MDLHTIETLIRLRSRSDMPEWREGDAWRSGVELPPAYRGYITTGGVTIDLDTERPYERNDWVVEHYRHHRDGDRDRDDHDHDHR